MAVTLVSCLCEGTAQGKESILEVASNIMELEKRHGLYDIIPEVDVSSILKFGLVEVVYEWACGKVSVIIMKATVDHGVVLLCHKHTGK